MRRLNDEIVRLLGGQPVLRDGVRVGLAMFAPIAIGALAGSLEVGLLIGIGGLLVSLCDTGGPYASRALTMGSVAVVSAALMGVGVLAGSAPALAVAATFVVMFVAALVAVLGAPWAIGGLVCGVSYALGIGLGLGSDAAVGTALLVLIGGVWATVLTIAPWPLKPAGPLVGALAGAYRALGAYAGAMADGAHDATPEAPPQGATLAPAEHTAAVQALASAAGMLHGGRRRAGRSGRSQRMLLGVVGAGRLLDGLAGLDAQVARAARVPAYPTIREVTVDALEALADAAEALAATVTDDAEIDLDPLDGALASLEDRLARVRGGLEQPTAADLQAYVDVGYVALALRDAVAAAHVAAEATAGRRVVDPVAPEPRESGITRAVTTLRAQFTLHSTPLRFALRLAIACVVSGIAATLIDPAHIAWTLTTTVAVLKPDFGGTLERGLQRVAGTLVGAVIAGALAATIDAPAILLLLAFVCAVAGFSVLRIDYAVFTVFITPMAILLVSSIQGGSWDFSLDRSLDTVVGCVLAIVAGYLVFPSRERERMPEQLERAIDTLAAHVTATFEHLAGRGDGDDVFRARRSAELEGGNTSAGVQRLLSEPRGRRGPAQPVADAADYAQRALAASASLARRPGFDAASLDTFDAIERALRSRLDELARAARARKGAPENTGLEAALAPLRTHVQELTAQRARELAQGEDGETETIATLRSIGRIERDLDELALALEGLADALTRIADEEGRRSAESARATRRRRATAEASV